MNDQGMQELFESAIHDSLCLKKIPVRLHEPDYTALLTLNLPDKLNRQLPRIVSLEDGESVRLYQPLYFSGCFVHQSPYVRFFSHSFNSNRTCEIGDLLVLCKETSQDNIRYNAAILQLKLSRKLRIPKTRRPVKISGVRDRTQLDLYSNWPEFNFDRPVQEKKYDLSDKHAFAGAQYMFVCEDRTTSFSVAMPQGAMYAYDYPFAKFLTDFIAWRTGKEFKDKLDSSHDEWSELIWDILNHVAEQKIQRSNIGEESVRNRYNDAGKIGLGFMQGGPAVSDWDIPAIMATMGERRHYNRNSFGVLWIAKNARGIYEFER